MSARTHGLLYRCGNKVSRELETEFGALGAIGLHVGGGLARSVGKVIRRCWWDDGIERRSCQVLLVG